MIDRTVDIKTPSGPMETFVTHPEEGGPFPAVILYMDVWGVREELFDIARRIGTVGYHCIVPDLYHRQGKKRFEFRDAQGHAISMNRLEESKRSQVLGSLDKLSNAMVMDDTQALLDFLAHGQPAKPGAMGSVGYCMGGRHVLCAAAMFRDRFRASASLHGTALISDAADSPHRQVDKFQGEVYCGFAEHDPYAPMSMVEELARLMKSSPAGYRSIVHKGAEHGYALPQRDIHDKAAFERDWEHIFAMFHRQIPPYA